MIKTVQSSIIVLRQSARLSNIQRVVYLNLPLITSRMSLWLINSYFMVSSQIIR